MTDDLEMLTTAEAARWLRCSVRHVRDLLDDGLIRGVKLIAPFTLHTLRKSFAQNHADAGTPPSTTAPLGHGLSRRQEGSSSILIPLAASVASVLFR